ncbi:hypothetical protein INT46_003368 [Mucor plumbeus]|uniref:Uncharacterized protein n=1 Tax=Mucor plumbeus TaxID=97098 RepID=A0A8H7QHX2_9FUNG|nr:hypothetical protein INT46_003368 [Mucor plumbeus]
MDSINRDDNQVSSYQNNSKINDHLKSTYISSNHTIDNNTSSKDWITCDDNNMIKESYNCESRPYMTVLLVISILILLFLRKSSIIKNYISSHKEKLSQENQPDEEEGLMQRVF